MQRFKRRLELFVLVLAAVVSPAAAEKTPNILLIMADDFGYECVGANGSSSYSTPHLDRLAAGGMRFMHCYAQPLCTPTRVQLMTGQYNVRNYVRFGLLDPQQVTFGNLLKKAGYATGVVGKWQLENDFQGPGKFGFDEYCLWKLTRQAPRYANPGLEINGHERDYRNGEYGPDRVNQYALDFLDRHKDRPFFLYYPMLLTHPPFQPTPDSPDWDPRATGDKANQDSRHFGEMVTYMDKLIGKLVTRLEELQLRGRTLILFTGDNGTKGGIQSRLGDLTVEGGKGQMTDAGTRVPLIVNWPGTIPPGKVSSDLVDSTDFLPTICQAAGAPLPEDFHLDGLSFLPQLLGQKGEPRQWSYCWYAPSQGQVDTPREFARTRRYKLYGDGSFYEVDTLRYQEQPLDANNLDAEAAVARQKLQAVLEGFKDARPKELVARGV